MYFFSRENSCCWASCFKYCYRSIILVDWDFVGLKFQCRVYAVLVCQVFLPLMALLLIELTLHSEIYGQSHKTTPYDDQCLSSFLCWLVNRLYSSLSGIWSFTANAVCINYHSNNLKLHISFDKLVHSFLIKKLVHQELMCN